MKRFGKVVLAVMALVFGSSAGAQFNPGMTAGEVQVEAAAQLQENSLADVIAAMSAAGLSVEVIITTLVGVAGKPGFESITLETIVQAAIVAGLPAATVVSAVIQAADALPGGIDAAAVAAVVEAAVAADVAVNGTNADLLGIAQAAADSGKLDFTEAGVLVGATVVTVEQPTLVEPEEPAVSVR
jgi:hypothetical protein